MRHRAKHNQEAQGYDSFLDIVANLVGILIILVLVIGARAKDAMLQVETKQAPAEAKPIDIRAVKYAEISVRQELENLVQKMKRQKLEIAYRRTERDRILERITAAEKALKDEVAKLDEASQDAHDQQARLDRAEKELENLKLSLVSVEQSEAPVQVIKHRPTPLAQTVFGQEVHFRLKDGHLVFVPIDSLVERFKAEAREKAWKLRQAPQITETVGPIAGFRLKYTLKKAEYSLETRIGPAVQQRVELDHFVLVPVRDDLGESLDQALRPDSQFLSILNSFDPNQATVTVWVYPDSYPQFRRLKDDLFRRGYLTASRPLPAGQPISGSPSGTHSAVQ